MKKMKITASDLVIKVAIALGQLQEYNPNNKSEMAEDDGMYICHGKKSAYYIKEKSLGGNRIELIVHDYRNRENWVIGEFENCYTKDTVLVREIASCIRIYEGTPYGS